MVPTLLSIHSGPGMGLGIEFSRHQRQSRSSGAILGSTDASANTSSQGSLSGPDEDGEGEGAALYRAIYPFPGTTDDEVCTAIERETSTFII